MSTNLVLQPGRIGISVNKMQGYLNLMQQRGMITMVLKEDGVYGTMMSKAVREAQRYLNLPMDGIIGETTWNAIMEEIRKMHGVKQEELAEALNVSRQTIGSLENGRYNPSILLAFKIARYFDTTIEKIFLYEEETDHE